MYRRAKRKNFMNKKIVIYSIILVVLALASYKIFYQPQIKKAANTPNGDSAESKKFEAANGTLVEEDASKRRPLAVIVENHPDSRPQSGLSQADIVYETLAEGGVTRFLAIFQSQEAKNIGPVRSAREYFAQIADEWHALFAHVGGSNEVIDQLKRGVYKNLSDANEYYNEYNFGRDKNKPAPHNVFTSTARLEKLMEEHKYGKLASYDAWQFKNDEPASTSTASYIDIDFSRLGYEVTWKHQTDKNNYQRVIYGGPDKDAENSQPILAKNVLVQYVAVTPVPKDPLLSVDIDLSSGGRAVVFQDGIVAEGAWKKQNNRTRFFDASGREIKFNRGQIWVELVPEGKAVEWQ